MPELKLNGDHFLGLGSAFLSVEDKEISLKDRGPRLTKGVIVKITNVHVMLPLTYVSQYVTIYCHW